MTTGTLTTGTMTSFDAMMLIEDPEGACDGEYIAAFQLLIDEGIVWNLQGFYGRTAMRLIEDGLCTSAMQSAAGEDYQ